MKMRIQTWFYVGAIGLTLSCSSSDNKKETVDWSIGRGTAACHEWQKAYCELANKCNGTDVATCATQMQSFECVSDTAARDCSAMLNANTCASSVAGCEIKDVVDPSFAIEACTTYRTAVCTHNANCGSTVSVTDCLTAADASGACSNASGAKLVYEQCLIAANSAACTATASAECKSIFYSGS